MMTGKTGRILLALLVAGSIAACSRYPADIRGSLEQAKQDALEVGVADAPPWIAWNEGKPAGVEADLIRAFAAREDLAIEWVHRDEDTLLRALEHGELHIVAAGLTKKTPWKKHVSLSEPVSTCRAYIGVPATGAPTLSDKDIKALTVRVERAGGLAHRVEKRGATVERVQDLSEGAGPAAAEKYRLAELGLTPVGDTLARTTHVLAVPHGENALYAALTRALPARPGCLPLEGGRP
ncbi:substrate-binding periplasmic protein [Henriciella aquimarina]|uniref:substrate-binding periplasmic protein n=1 Tax=Henriciella aquimarina TaxID=545261 RepID=UPI0009FD86B9|nr:transporter substrate-binding domain-containing protein [Henriciella aquimarina]